MASPTEIAIKEARDNERMRVQLEQLIAEMEAAGNALDNAAIKAALEKILRGQVPAR